jgi:hypothetical protein
VTSPDRVTLRAGDGLPVEVTANDIDPDGEQLQVCRIGPVPRALRGTMVQDGVLIVVTSRRALGTYTVTYYACDSSYLTAGTLTVKVRPAAPTLDIIPVGDGPPGRIRIVNTYKNRTFHCTWRPLDSDKVEGKVTVRPHSSVVIEVHEAKLMIECTSPHVGYSAVFARRGPGGVTSIER